MAEQGRLRRDDEGRKCVRRAHTLGGPGGMEFQKKFTPSDTASASFWMVY